MNYCDAIRDSIRKSRRRSHLRWQAKNARERGMIKTAESLERAARSL